MTSRAAFSCTLLLVLALALALQALFQSFLDQQTDKLADGAVLFFCEPGYLLFLFLGGAKGDGRIALGIHVCS